MSKCSPGGRKNKNRAGEGSSSNTKGKTRIKGRGSISFLRKLETEGNYAWNMVSFLCKLETKSVNYA